MEVRDLLHITAALAHGNSSRSLNCGGRGGVAGRTLILSRRENEIPVPFRNRAAVVLYVATTDL